MLHQSLIGGIATWTKGRRWCWGALLRIPLPILPDAVGTLWSWYVVMEFLEQLIGSLCRVTPIFLASVKISVFLGNDFALDRGLPLRRSESQHIQLKLSFRGMPCSYIWKSVQQGRPSAPGKCTCCWFWWFVWNMPEQIKHTPPSASAIGNVVQTVPRLSNVFCLLVCQITNPSSKGIISW